jgi:hypothetical protein
MNTSKKIILGCALGVTLVSGFANADVAVTVGSVNESATGAITDPAPFTVTSGGYAGLVQTQFVFNRSRNITIASLPNAAGTGVAITTASMKGRNQFFANSGGTSASVCGAPAVGSAAPVLRTLAVGDTEASPC